jgi:Flp pilus assembly protein TadG
MTRGRRSSSLSRPARRTERGTALVEFSIIVPLFMMLVLGTFSGGLAYNKRIDLTHAVREGARYGAALPQDQANWAQLVRDNVVNRSGGDLKAGDVCVALVSGGSGGSVVTGDLGGPWSSVPAGYPANCYADDNSDTGMRVHVAAHATAKVEALVFSYPVNLNVQATSRHE